MKNYALQPGLILLALGVIALTVYIGPTILNTMTNVSYRFVLFFVVIILASNILARITSKYINS